MIELSKILPGIPTLPIIGNVLFFIKNKNDFPIAMEKVGRQLKKNFCLWFGPVSLVTIIEPNDIEIILKSPIATDKEPTMYKIVGKMMGPSNLLSRNADKTYRSDKKFIMSMIHSESLSEFINTFNYHAKVLVKLLENKVEKMEFDLSKNMAHCMGDIVFETIFGIPGKNQHGEVEKFIFLTERLLDLSFERMMNPLDHLDFLYKLLNKNSKKWNYKKTQAKLFIENLYNEKKKNYSTLSKNENNDKFKNSFSNQLINRFMKTQEWTEEEVKTMLLASFVASNDTITGTILFAFLMIAMHKEVQDKIRQEINEFVHDDDLIDENIFKYLTYTEMTIKETVRLFPITPLMGRTISDDLKLSSYTLPKGCSLLISPFGVDRNPEYWIEPDKFNPERFTIENSINRPKFAYIPFSSGVRMCPGYKYGIACLKIIIAHVIRNYELSTSMKMSDLDLYMNISIRNRSGYPVSIKKLKS